MNIDKKKEEVDMNQKKDGLDNEENKVKEKKPSIQKEETKTEAKIQKKRLNQRQK